MSDLRRIYQQIKQRQPQINDGLARQKAWIMRDKLLFESSAAAGAAGAGAGAGGGGTNQYRRQLKNPQISVSNQSEFYYNNTDGFKYFIYDFEDSFLTETLTLDENIGSLQSVYPVTNGGYLIHFNDGLLNKFYFIDLRGNILWQDFNNNGEHVDIENFSTYVAPYYFKDGAYKLVMFDKNNTIRTFNFENFIEGGGYSYDNAWSNGIVVREDVSTLRKYYIVNFDDSTTTQFLVIDTDLGDTLNVYQYGFSDVIYTLRNSTIIEKWSSNGTKLLELDVISEFQTSNWYLNDLFFLDSNGACIINGYDDDNSERNIVFFSSTTNTFSIRTFPGNYSYDLDVSFQKNYIQTYNSLSEGAAFLYFRDTTNNIDCGDFEYNTFSAVLPIWSTDETLRDIYTFSNEMAIYDDFDDDNCCLIRNGDYIVTMIDNQPYGVYNFSDSSNSANQISDGGFDMYDNGNLLYADDVQINYTHTQLSSDRDQGMITGEFNLDGQNIPDVVFGTSSSEYFTNLYPGLFVMCAKNTIIDRFRIDGNTGADGLGSIDNFNFQVDLQSTYQVFVKQTFDIQEPSINHIVIVNASTASGITHSIGASTDNDTDSLEGLLAAGVTEIYYLLMSQFAGQKIELADLVSIANTFLSIRENSATNQDLLTNLNSEYSNITGILPSRGTLKLLRFNKEGDATTILPQEIGRNFSDEDRFGENCILQYVRYVNLPGLSGWDVLNDLESRKFSTFKAANRNAIGAYVIGQEFVMKDVTNNQYWGIQFTQWTQNDGGGFAYTRQLIENDSLTGSVITFTHSNFGYEVDVISEGVLEITRGNNGPIYNKALESESNGYGPLGTIWNSEQIYTYQASDHEIISRDGSLINGVSTESYNNNWNGNLYHLFDESTQINYVSNLTNGGEITNSFEGFYDIYVETPTSVRDSGLNSGNAIVYTERGKFRILTETKVSQEIDIPISVDFGKINNVLIFDNGAVIVTDDLFGTNFYFYNLDGELIFSKTNVMLADNIQSTNYGKRLSIQYPLSEDGLMRYFFFNGTSVTELTTDSTSYFSSMSNDYQNWN